VYLLRKANSTSQRYSDPNAGRMQAMTNREEPQDRDELDIEEIENIPAPRKLRSRPREITQIDHEEVNDRPSPMPRSISTTPTNDRNSERIRGGKKLQIAILGILAILLLSDLFIIYQISSLNSRLKDMDSDISKLTNMSYKIPINLNGQRENLSDSEKSNSSAPISSDPNRSTKFTLVGNRIYGKKIVNNPKVTDHQLFLAFGDHRYALK
jgi:hypothetical protein